MTASRQNRHDLILQTLCENGQASIKDLAEHVNISEATIRRDLKHLAAKGEIELIYGGAALPRLGNYSFHSKEMRNIDAKRIIGKLAAELVQDNDLIFLSAGTTVFQMASYLNRKRGLSVIGNSTRLAMELAAPNLTFLLIGGQHRPDKLDTVGPLALIMLNQLRGYRAFIGTDGLSMEFGWTASDVESAHLYAQTIQNARGVVLLADHTKFTAPSLYKIGSFDNIDKVVTDTRPSDEWMAFLQGKNIEVIYPQ
jgi:DeoR/GlpR family transcriptional regulator of sugar metabolism